MHVLFATSGLRNFFTLTVTKYIVASLFHSCGLFNGANMEVKSVSMIYDCIFVHGSHVEAHKSPK